MSWTGLLFSLRGRFSRAMWWSVQLGGAALAAAVFAVYRAGIIVPLGLILLVILMIVAVTITSGIRRLHDRDRSAWWLVPYYVGPALLDELAPLFGEDGGLIVEALALATAAWAMVELGFRPGIHGPTRHGADPRATIETTTSRASRG